MRMVVHDLRNPAESLQEGLSQVEKLIDKTFKSFFKETFSFFDKKVVRKRNIINKRVELPDGFDVSSSDGSSFDGNMVED